MISCRSPLVRSGIIASGCIAFLYTMILVAGTVFLSRFTVDFGYTASLREVIIFICSFIAYESGYYYYTRRFFCGGTGLPGEGRHPLISFVASSIAVCAICFAVIFSWNSSGLHGLVLASLIAALLFIGTIPLLSIYIIIAYSVLFRIISRTGENDRLLSRKMYDISSLPDRSMKSYGYSSRFQFDLCAIAVTISNADTMLSHYGTSTMELFNRQIAFLLIDRSRSFDIWGQSQDGRVYAAVLHVRGDDELSAAVNRVRHLLSGASTFLDHDGAIPCFDIRAKIVKTEGNPTAMTSTIRNAVSEALSDVIKQTGATGATVTDEGQDSE